MLPDGTKLLANVFRSRRAEEDSRKVPVVMCAHPYDNHKLPALGKTPLGGPPHQYRLIPQAGGRPKFSNVTSWESPDPNFWVPAGYAVVNLNLPGFGGSEGMATVMSDNQSKAYYEAIEWVARQPWCDGAVGLNGVSFLAITQFHVAACRHYGGPPPALKCIVPWEGLSDPYRDSICPGGIEDAGFLTFWWHTEVKPALTGSAAIFIKDNDASIAGMLEKHPLMNTYWREKAAAVDDIELPMLVGRFLNDRSKPVKDSSHADSWYSKCTQKIDQEFKDNATSQESIAKGLVMNIHGERLLEVDEPKINEAWGFSLSVCKDYCSRDHINMATNFNRIAAGSTSYLLPWLALTAQLPYETGGTGSDIMSVCLGLGSPMLMTVSLMVTILNKTWIRKAFRKLRNQDGVESGTGMLAKANGAVVIAEAAQQVPTRLVQTERALIAQMFLSDHNGWWKQAGDKLKTTRRGVTLSLVAQLSVAIIAWILTAVGSLKTKVGDTEEALVLSSGSLWIWLVPVILGWILVGTQNKAGTMQSALRGASGYRPEIEVADGLRAAPNARNPRNGSTSSPTRLWIFNVAGFQKQEGPAFNYARTLTWINFANNLLVAYEDAIRPHDMNATGLQQPPESQAAPQPSPAGSQASLTHQDSNSILRGPLYEYSTLNELSEAKPIFWKHLAFSILMGALIQWGTTILAFILAFETVVKGLGCRSGSYLIYGILSTAACASLVLSAALSHVAMRGYERIRIAKQQQQQNEPRLGLGAQLCGAFAVFLRLLGCFLLVANTVWLLLISIWELIGFFDSCYCASTELSKKESGWILLFKGTDALKEDAQKAWGIGIGLGFVLIFVAIAVFYLASRHKHD
ncbi:Cocaine esterase [Colletotrichum viniferum]|nr:Cocaine esterase [Colletotrichum viniferum]